eukprot:PITA_18292
MPSWFFQSRFSSMTQNFVTKNVDNFLFWSLYFDGSKSSEGECTNNTAEYEALVQGLYKAIGLKVQYLKFFGDSEIIVKQVRNTIHCLSNHIKHYQSLVQELTSHFLAFNISSIPRSQNSAADLLANVASKLLPSEDYSPDRFSVELLFRPSIPDNVTNWRVFNHDDDILQFLASEKSYVNQIIEEDEHDIQMRDKHEENSIPKRVVKLEDLYDIKDRFKPVSNTKLQSSTLRKNYDSILLRCLEKPEAQRVLRELHDGPAGGHFGGDTTAHKVIHVGYYWPTLFRDAHEYVRKCQNCQTSSGRQKKSAFPLQPVNIEQPFEQWGLDIIGEISPNSSKQHKYILTATDYFTKWVEVIPLKTTNSEAIIECIDQFIITRFGVLNALVFDNASYFSGNAMFDFAIKRGFKLKYSTNYYPQGNGLAESTNKNLIKIIKRTIEQNHKNWHKSLIFALWADRITQKASIGSSPFKLFYGKEVVLPTNLILPSLALVQFIDESPSSSLQLRHDQILKLEEEREKAKIIHAKHQQIINSSFDSISSGSKQFQVGDLVLKWDKAHEDKGKHTKFKKMWLGPFHICETIGHSTFILQDLSELRDSLPVNGLILKKLFN